MLRSWKLDKADGAAAALRNPDWRFVAVDIES